MGKSVVAPSTEDVTQLDEVNADVSYVLTSPIKFTHKRVTAGDEVYSEFRYLRRVPIKGNWFFQAGVEYERFDFGGGNAGPLPGGLQDINLPIGIVYMVQNHTGFLAQIRPGFWFEHRIDTGAFDIPIEIGGVYPLQKDKLFLAYGVGTSILREWPVLPTLGLVWIIDDHWKLFGVAPEPKLVYTCNDRFSVWLGGELFLEAFSTDRNNFALTTQRGHTTSGSVCEYSEYRVGLGATYSPVKYWDINFAAGYSFDRSFDFWRADKSYTADPAPFVRLQMKASF